MSLHQPGKQSSASSNKFRNQFGLTLGPSMPAKACRSGRMTMAPCITYAKEVSSKEIRRRGSTTPSCKPITSYNQTNSLRFLDDLYVSRSPAQAGEAADEVTGTVQRGEGVTANWLIFARTSGERTGHPSSEASSRSASTIVHADLVAAQAGMGPERLADCAAAAQCPASTNFGIRARRCSRSCSLGDGGRCGDGS